MIDKNKEKMERLERRKRRGQIWNNYRPVFEVTKKERIEKKRKKYKGKIEDAKYDN